MSPSSLVKLINSLSGPEKRNFKLQSQIQKGSKEYLLLFELIEHARTIDLVTLKAEFKKQSPGGSWDNTCVYLGNMLMDSLVRAKRGKNAFFDLLQQVQEIRILNERSLEHEAFRKAEKARQQAAHYQLHWIEYFFHRYELNYHSDTNFADIDDKGLVQLQMKGKEVLKSLNHIHDHYSLYELLKYRLVHAGKIVAEEDKKKLNDLMLSEMVLVAGRSKSFASQKLHLLFQSFFFSDIGEYRSALKSFHQLNDLLEKNKALLDNPPLDYLSALTGIIDSFHMAGNEAEVGLYLERISLLDDAAYPEYFRYLVRKTFYTQQVLALVKCGSLEEARRLVADIPADVFESYAMIDEEKQCELYFYCSLVHFRCGDWKKAHLLLREIMNQFKLPEHLLVSKAIRLLNILIYFEKGDFLHLEYEVRSYKRYFRNGKLLRIEKLVFRIITAANERIFKLENEQRKIAGELAGIAKDRYEQQVLKYIDLAGWVQEAVSRKSKTGRKTAGKTPG